MQDVIAASVGLAGIFLGCPERLRKNLPGIVVTEEARRSRKGQGIGDDVERIAAVQAPDGIGQALLRWTMRMRRAWRLP